MIRRLYLIILAIALCFPSLPLLAQNSTKATPKNNEAIPAKNKSSVKLIEYIVGTWKVNGMYNGSKNVSETAKSSLGQVINFNREGRFVSHSNNEKIDSGAYRLNEDQSILYLESASGGKPTEWNIWFKKNIMNLQQKNAPANTIKYIYSRAGISKAQ
jgi:hypothetical protein